MTSWKQRSTAGAFATAAVVLLVASLTYACTTFYEKLTVTGNGATPGSVTATGNETSMGWCFGPSGTANVDDSTNGTVGVTVAPGGTEGTCNTPNLFPTGGRNTTYDIRWTTGTWDPSGNGGAGSGSDCMNTTDPDIGNIFISSGGTGSATSDQFNPGAVGTISICVIKGSLGNQVPVSVV